MSQARLKFEAPPVVEMALSVQFNRLPGYTTAHSGWFWKEYLENLGDETSNRWNQLVETPRLDDQFELFGSDDVWMPPLSMKFLPGAQSQRLQIIRADNERMLQVQDSRFILNWRKQKSAYPTYDTLLPEFRTMFHTFEAFVGETKLGPLAFNQWEVIYVDQLKKGEMWKSARDWNQIFPGLSMLPMNIPQVPPSDDETLSADWRFSLADRRGQCTYHFDK